MGIVDMQLVDSVEALASLLRADLAIYDMDTRIEHPGIRISMAVHRLVRAIKAGDRAAANLGCALLIRDPRLPFGKILKSNISRALKQHPELLSEQEKLCLASKTAELLSLEYCPREVEDYCRLVKKLESAVVEVVIEKAWPINGKAVSLLAYLIAP
jgi:hypothetical protein